jgi:hypothetical protein
MKHQDASSWMQHTINHFICSKTINGFSLYYISCKENECGEILNSWQNHFLIVLSIHILKLEISECHIVSHQAQFG